jgi:hypothetical protein
MDSQEQAMSDAKREHREFQHTAAAGRAFSRAKATGSAPWAVLEFAGLRVVESWETQTLPSGDPYNGVGARAVSGPTLRK